MSKRTVVGITKTHEQAASLVKELRNKEFGHANISILYPAEATRMAAALDESALPTDTTQTETRAPEGAVLGATAGTAIGGTLGVLAGLGALAIPGFGPFLAVGPIFAVLSGLGAGAAIGGVAGGLVGLGIPEHHARKYENLVQDGATLVAAHCDSAAEQRRATDAFVRAGATDIMASPEIVSSVRPVNMERDPVPITSRR